MSIFDPDSWFSRIGGKVFDLIVLTLLTLMIGLFSFTVLLGPALTAFFYTVDKVVVHERGYLLKNYFRSLKMNLLKGIVMGIILTVGFGLIGYIMVFSGGDRTLLIGLYFILVELVIISSYCFVLLSKFHLSVGEILVKSLLYGHKHLLTTLVIVSVVGTLAWLTVNVHAVLMILGFGPGGYVISRLVLERVLVKYVDPESLVAFNGDGGEE